MATQTDTLHIWLISPYHTGSHRVWAEGLRRHSRHTVTLLTMPGRFWKWRMQGGALELAQAALRELDAGHLPDVILATDMLNVPAWLGLLRRRLPGDVPLVLYMHENQLTYPLQPGEKRDLTYAMINWLSQCAVDVVVFNSDYHRRSWFDALPNLLKHFPDFNHLARIDEVRNRSRVLPVGLACAEIPAPAQDAAPSHEPPLILWNQRWEYDKQPAQFFELLYALQAADVPFRVAVAGENFRNVPEEFLAARTRLGDAIAHWGFLPHRAAYLDLLNHADLVISTALHEFFGISVMEAIAAGAFPLLPNRLSYPELIPKELHPACLYEDEQALFEKAQTRLLSPRRAPPSLRRHVRTNFDWSTVAAAYDALLEETVATPHR